MRREHTYILAISKEGTAVGEVAIPPARFDPAIDCLELTGVRRGLFGDGAPPELDPVLEPLWDEKAGAPYVRAVQLSLPVGAGGVESGGLVEEFPLTYFGSFAQEAAKGLVREGRLEEGDLFHYQVLAFPADSTATSTSTSARPPARESDLGFEVEKCATPLPLTERSLAELASSAVAAGKARKGELPVFLPHRILEEAIARKDDASGVETGGILIGYLRRDRTVPEVFLEITAQVPGHHTRGERHRLTFTADTWSAVQTAIDLRGKGEVMLGWWHSHPAREWCRDCDPVRWEKCPYARSFLSAEDVLLHRTVFPKPYGVALVVGDRASGEVWETFHTLYGWRQGVLGERGYSVLGSPPAEGAP